MTDLLILGGVLMVTAALAVGWRARQGRVTTVHDGRLHEADRAALDAPPDVALLLEFTAPGCTPCAATGRILGEVAAERDGIAVVLADVGRHPDLARAHRVLRAPTTLVVAADGAVRHRISGVPDPAEVAELLDGGGLPTRNVA
jgi:thiol-disulfide isomerase/thioredoxin